MDPIPWDRRARSVDGLGSELIVQERREEGQGGAGATNTNFETSAGRGVYTSGRWGKVFDLTRSTAVSGSEVIV